MEEDEDYNVYIELKMPDIGSIEGETLIGHIELDSIRLKEAEDEVQSILDGFKLNPALTVKYTLNKGYVKKEIFDCFAMSKDEYWLTREHRLRSVLFKGIPEYHI